MNIIEIVHYIIFEGQELKRVENPEIEVRWYILFHGMATYSQLDEIPSAGFEKNFQILRRSER